MFTIAHGNIFDGISLHGLFNNREDASEHAQKCMNVDGNWWIVFIDARED